MNFDIIEYLGKYENGVLVLISLNYNDNYYDTTFFYRENFVTLTIDSDLEDIIGQVELWSEYNNLVLDIMKKVIPYDEIINRLDEIDFSGFFEQKAN
jgi:hypothetical protein